MAYDEGIAELMRADLTDHAGVSERKMFGGLCFLVDGHMLCGVHKGGGMFRIGKDREAEARRIDGTGPMEFTGRPMRGFVDVTDDLLAEDDRRGRLMDMALGHVGSLPPR